MAPTSPSTSARSRDVAPNPTPSPARRIILHDRPPRFSTPVVELLTRKTRRPWVVLLTAILCAWFREKVSAFAIPPYPSEETLQELTDLSAELYHPSNYSYALSQEQIDQYNELGYTVARGALSPSVLEAVRKINDHIYAEPSNMMKLANRGKFCGFALHSHMVMPYWREIAYRLPFSDYASQLLGAERVSYIQDIHHWTGPECFRQQDIIDFFMAGTMSKNMGGGPEHSDINQSPFSIEKRDYWGDNMLIAWTALDDTEGLLDLKMFPRTHVGYRERDFTTEKYCKFWEDLLPNLPEPHSLSLKAGDVLLFSGTTFHSVTKSPLCTPSTCRRLSIRYSDSSVTRFRDDIAPSPWPFIKANIQPGKSIDGIFPSVYPELNRGKFKEGQVLVPSLFEWMKFGAHIARNGFSSSDIIFKCPFSSASAAPGAAAAAM